jgi:hypothetical protein
LDLRLFVFIIVPSLTNQSIIDTFNKYATERPNATDYVNSTNKLHQLGDLIESESQHTQFAPPHTCSLVGLDGLSYACLPLQPSTQISLLQFIQSLIFHFTSTLQTTAHDPAFCPKWKQDRHWWSPG